MSITLASRRGFMRAALATGAILASGYALADGAEPMLKITGELTYLQRIALPDDAIAIVEIKADDAADGDSVTAETRIALEGRQVPVPFTLDVPRAHLDAAKKYLLRGGILIEAQMRWLTEPVPVETGGPSVDVGTLRLSPYEAPPPFGIDGKALLAGEWRIAELDGRAIPADIPATIVFDEDGGFSGKLCNSYRGAYTVDDSGISFGKAAATLMACPEPQATYERALFAAFETATGYRVGQDGTVTIVDADGKSLLQATR